MPGKPFSIPHPTADGWADHGEICRGTAQPAGAIDICDPANRIGGAERYTVLADPDLDLVTGWRRCRGQSDWDRRRQRRLRRTARRR